MYAGKALWVEKNPLTKVIGVEEIIKFNIVTYMLADRFVVLRETLNSENKMIFIKYRFP